MDDITRWPLKIILDLPYDFYNHIWPPMAFLLAQHYDELKDTPIMEVLKTFPIMLDNGAWVQDGGEAMGVYDYMEIIDELNPAEVISPDVLGNATETKELFNNFIVENIPPSPS